MIKWNGWFVVRLIANLWGWYGVIVAIVAYGFIASGQITGDNIFWLHFFNLTAAIGITYVSCLQRAWQAIVLNGFYSIIAAISIIVITFF